MYKNPTGNIKLKSESRDALPTQSRMRRGCPLSTSVFDIGLEALAVQSGKRKQEAFRSERKKYNCLFTNDKIIYAGKPMEHTKKL